MPVNVLMPALSPTMEKGKLAKWLKKEGDTVKSGDVLAEIETDKATMEVEAVDEGIVGKLLIAEGTDDVLVNTPIAVILGEGETAGDISASPSPVAAKAAPPSPARGEGSQAAVPSTSPLAGEGAVRSTAGEGSRVFASPLAKRIAKSKGIVIATLLGSGPHGRIVLKDVENAKPGATPRPSSPLAGEVARSAGGGPSDEAVLKLFEPGSYDLVPHDGMRKTIARRLTESKQTIPHFYVSVDVTLENLLALRERLNLQAPKDKDGKPAWKISVNDFIIKSMAMALIKVPDANVSWTENAKPGVSVPAATAAKPAMAPGMADDMVLKLFEAGSYELVPHDGMRKTIARRLTESKQTIPHFYVSVDVALDNLLALRERLNLHAPKDKDGKPLWKISVNDFIIKAMAMALVKVPDANVSWTDNAMVKHKHADIGVAVTIPGGLITPIVRKAETKGLARISTEMKDLAGRARNKKLKPEEYTGGSAAVSNLGMMNVRNFAAIVNPPHATILAIGTGERRPVVRGHDIVIEQQMTITLSTDHRAVDGALGAEFIGAIRMYLEEPGLMLV